VARKQIGVKRESVSSSASAGKSDESGGGHRTPAKRQAVMEKKPTGFVKRVAKMLDTGIAGIEQVTDLGMLLGNIGTHKILSKLDGKSGNQEIFKMLIKYVGTYLYNARNKVGAHNIIVNLYKLLYMNKYNTFSVVPLPPSIHIVIEK